MSRRPDELRPILIKRGFPTAAPGSVLIECGDTRVLCTASVSSEPPGWLMREDPPRGWINAEYNMLPASTKERKRRGTDGRSTEIQRLIGRVLRASVDLYKMPGLAITCDCEVLSADGGTRTTSITGAFVALCDAITYALDNGQLKESPIVTPVAAVSVGIVDGVAVLDLDYPLDSNAEVDLNVAMTEAGEFIEIQGTAEKGAYSRTQLNQMLDLAERGMREIFELQKISLHSPLR
ncbi:MAG: ribonuclease PH [bacterium]|nr:ribonuclease PH [bacterium]